VHTPTYPIKSSSVVLWLCNLFEINYLLNFLNGAKKNLEKKLLPIKRQKNRVCAYYSNESLCRNMKFIRHQREEKNLNQIFLKEQSEKKAAKGGTFFYFFSCRRHRHNKSK
jgi:hypothetical protein